MSLVPNFRHFRLLNIISLVGTAYTAVYLIATAGVCHFLCLLSLWTAIARDLMLVLKDLITSCRMCMDVHAKLSK